VLFSPEPFGVVVLSVDSANELMSNKKLNCQGHPRRNHLSMPFPKLTSIWTGLYHQKMHHRQHAPPRKCELMERMPKLRVPVSASQKLRRKSFSGSSCS
jgi:hypothetical protein